MPYTPVAPRVGARIETIVGRGSIPDTIGRAPRGRAD